MNQSNEGESETSAMEITERLMQSLQITKSRIENDVERAASSTPTQIDDARAIEQGKGHNPDMTAITRDEFDSKLASTRSDIRADFADLRADMAQSRRESSEQLNQMRVASAEQLSAIRVDMSSMSTTVSREVGRIAEGVAELRGSVDGLKSSISMFQWVLAIVAALAGIWLAYQQLKLSESTPQPLAAAAAAPQQPITINIPPQQTTAPPK